MPIPFPLWGLTCTAKWCDGSRIVDGGTEAASGALDRIELILRPNLPELPRFGEFHVCWIGMFWSLLNLVSLLWPGISLE